MAIGKDDSNEWDLPRLKVSIGFEYQSLHDQDTEFFDAKFYPNNDLDADPVFAAISKKHIVVYRLSKTNQPPYELIQLIRDDDEQAVNCSCTWSMEPETGLPWLCVAGFDAKIKVYDVFHGTLVRLTVIETLVGHGAEINDLTTCPTNPQLIASASDDTTVRLWSLDPKDEKQPCVCILGGEGHSSGLLTVAFHSCGRYILSAGHDNCVCLWTLPDLDNRPTDKFPPQPIVVHYPHFFTSEVHSGIVDCVAFFGDLILSRACHEEIIVLWRIEGFSSRDPVPLPSDAPTTSDTERLTRSAFAPATATACPPQYTRLIQFFTPGSGHQFYMRFKLFHDPVKHPVLAFGNAHSSIFFWDLARLLEYHDFKTKVEDPDRKETVQRPSFLQVVNKKGDPVSKVRDAEDRDSVTSSRTGSVEIEPREKLRDIFSPDTIHAWEGKYDMTRVIEPVIAHYQANIAVKDFIGRQVAWSPGGEWCIVVGSKNLAIALQRWDLKDKKKASGH